MALPPKAKAGRSNRLGSANLFRLYAPFPPVALSRTAGWHPTKRKVREATVSAGKRCRAPPDAWAWAPGSRPPCPPQSTVPGSASKRSALVRCGPPPTQNAPHHRRAFRASAMRDAVPRLRSPARGSAGQVMGSPARAPNSAPAVLCPAGAPSHGRYRCGEAVGARPQPWAARAAALRIRGAPGALFAVARLPVIRPRTNRCPGVSRGRP